MGLDITAYSNIKRLDAHLNDDGEAVNNSNGEQVEEYYFHVWKNPSFPGRADELVDGAIYTYEDCTGHGVGYGGYYWWRNELAEMAGYPVGEYESGHGKEANHFGGVLNSDSGPFYELINFSDCEGFIGTSVATKLLADFKTFHDKAEEIGGLFFEQYKHWQSAMEMASNNGCISFH
ncbi:hypothetical protein QFV42_RS18670 [Escherichia coli]|nr:hypothetical protein [Escherichia coli]EKP9354509.1 hypothetical protein [Escherichia coli]EKP9378885.1 hypothetical protein [Escherichia coli]EKP9556413.1 hypothetical protein [Escherichia coli]EKP9615764.1 hypothetical protein [Escherichia coli]